jgi:hypothetical protein
MRGPKKPAENPTAPVINAPIPTDRARPGRGDPICAQMKRATTIEMTIETRGDIHGGRWMESRIAPIRKSAK